MAEIIRQPSPSEPPLKPTHRSRVSNGSKLLPLADGQSVTARRFRDIFEEIGADLGGLDNLSEAQKQIARRAAALSAESERQEALWARGEAEFDVQRYTVQANTLRRLLETLGIERRPRPVADGRNALLDAHGLVR